jgi:hypothetical protein
LEAILSALRLLFLYFVLILPALPQSAPMTGTRRQETDRLEGYRILSIATARHTTSKGGSGTIKANHSAFVVAHGPSQTLRGGLGPVCRHWHYSFGSCIGLGGGVVHYAKKQMKVLMNNNCEL